MQPGDQIGDYIINRYVGEGGMSVVYLAEHKGSGTQVVVKQLQDQHSFNQQFVDRFVQGAEIMRDLRHPHLARVFDSFERNGHYFFVEEYLSGGSLADLLDRREPITEVQALRWCRDVLQGINYAHENGIVHRDLKPGNLMLNDKGEVKVTDFGIAKAFGGPRMTKTGTEMGTTPYMSPEQIRAPDKVDHLTDVYSMGVVLYELLSGKLPFDGDSDFDTKERVVREPPVPLRQHIAGISPRVEQAVLKALQKRTKDRFGGCNEFALEIQRILAHMGGTEPIPVLPWYRRKIPIGLGLAALALIGVFLVLPLARWIRGDGVVLTLDTTNVSLSAGQNHAFIVSVSGGDNQTVKWSRSPEIGTLSPEGVYSAPATIPQATTVTITASLANTAKSIIGTVQLIPSNAIVVRVAPNAFDVWMSQTKTFAVAVTGTPNTEVTWSLSPEVGRISADGTYTAPESITAEETITVIATSKADGSTSDSANITLKPVTLTLAPTTAELQPGKRVQFVATVGGTSNSAVSWSAGVSPDGWYTAPSSISSEQTVTVTATSKADRTKSDSALVTLKPIVVPRGQTTVTTSGASQQQTVTNIEKPPDGDAGRGNRPPISISISVTPREVTLDPAEQQTFVATVVGSPDESVDWSMTGPGRLTNNVYQAPASITSEQTATIKVTSRADPQKSATATVKLRPRIPPPPPPPPQPERVCFYQDIQYVALEPWCYNGHPQISDLGDRRDKISSIRVFGGASVSVYDDRNFGGDSTEFKSDVPDLGVKIGNKLWNDRIGSVRVFPRVGVCVFESDNFQGKSDCWIPGENVPDLAKLGDWNDEISSIRIFGPAAVVIYRDGNYSPGESIRVDIDAPDLNKIRRGSGNWNNQISSLKVQTR